jgi:hypothetical protein
VPYSPPAAPVSDETIRLVQEAMSNRQFLPEETRALTLASNLTGYELEAPAKAIVPVITPLVNMMPRRPGQGNTVCNWKAITSFDTGRTWGTLSGTAYPTEVTPSIVNMSNTYQSIAAANSVPFQLQWRGKSLEGDVRARWTSYLLYQLKIIEEKWIIQASANIMTPANPVLATAATGGSITANTYWVQVTAKNAQGETLGSVGGSSIVTTGSTSTITYTIFTVPNATQYNVYVGNGATLPASSAMWLQASVSGANAVQPGYGVSVAVSGGAATNSGELFGPVVVVTETAAISTSGTALSTVASNTAKTFIDGSSNALMFDGILAQAVNNTGSGNGQVLQAQVMQASAATGILALNDIDALLLNLNTVAKGDPDFLVMHPILHRKLTNLVIAANNTQRYIDIGQPEQQGRLTAQYRVTHYENVATGKIMPIIPSHYCPVDTLFALPMSIPFPTPEVSNAVEIEYNQNYWGVDFAITDSSYKFADYVDETVKVYYLGGLGVIRGCLPAA